MSKGGRREVRGCHSKRFFTDAATESAAERTRAVLRVTEAPNGLYLFLCILVRVTNDKNSPAVSLVDCMQARYNRWQWSRGTRVGSAPSINSLNKVRDLQMFYPCFTNKMLELSQVQRFTY